MLDHEAIIDKRVQNGVAPEQPRRTRRRPGVVDYK